MTTDLHIGDLAVRDHGGDGPAVVLLHGAGRNLLDWELVVPHLTGHRLVAVDLRGHGQSGGAEWSFTQVLDDVADVIDALSLDNPALVGHSLGGMIAALWATSRPCQSAVNLDGHGLGTPDLYDDTPPQVAATWISQLNQLQRDGARDTTVSPEQVVDLVAAGQAVAALWGVSPDLAEQSVRRAIGPAGQVRPSARTVHDLLDELDALDLLTVYGATTSPLLVVNAVAPDPSVAAVPIEGSVEMMASYRRGLSRALAAAADAHDLLSVVDVDADHALLLNQPTLVAELVEGFLARS